MSSHLAVSYSPTSQSGLNGQATGASAPTAGDNPLGFLAALIDQLTGAGTSVPSSATTTASQSLATGLDALLATQDKTKDSSLADTLATLLGGTSAAVTDTAAPTSTAAVQALLAEIQGNPAGAALIGRLTKALDSLGAQLDAGETPDPDALKKLSDTIDAIMALIAAPQQTTTATTPAATGNGLDALSAIGTSTATPAASPLPAIADLAKRLTDLGTSLRTAAPGIADKLDALSQAFNAAQSDPTLLAKLTNATDSDGTALDTLVKALLKGQPNQSTTSTSTSTASVPTSPAIASPQALAMPQALAVDSTTKSDTKTADTSAVLDVKPADPKAASAPDAKDTADSGSARDDKSATSQVIAAATAKTESDSTPARDTGTSATTAINAAQPAQTAATAAKILPAAYQNAAANINMAQVAFEMVHQMRQGQSRFTIRLDPPELGRVDVRMHVDQAGAVTARLTVERTETLDMFQRDKTTLERALSQAGLDGSKTNLEFSLRQNPFAGMAGGDRRPGAQTASAARFSADDGDTIASPVPAVTLYRGIASAGGVNMFV